MASSSQVLNDQANGVRLSRLLINKGTQALRATLDAHVGHLPSTLAAVLNTNKAILKKLRYKVINPSQWKLLYPSSGTPDSKTFDVTLLTVLLRNICGLATPASGWDALPLDSDMSVPANIARIKFYRNHVHAHITTTEITDNEFENLWLKISKTLIALGIPKSDLDELKEAPLSPEEADYIDLLEDWCRKEARLNADVNETLGKYKEFIEQKFRENEKVPDVNKLCKCDFSGIRESLDKKFLPGTRQWLFDKFSAWFEDKNSKSNVMILTAGPGVGKSVFAAEVCRIYDEKGQMAACHFCQFNKSDYRNPRMIIESLASNMCDKVEGFEAKLHDQLQRNHSRETLSDAFRVLLNDPLRALKNSKPMLLVIDALDESAVAGKSEFLELISEEFPKLPQWIKILITSRPELPVKEELKHLNPVEITPRDKDNEEDLLKYLQESLSHICNDSDVFLSLSLECQGSFLFAYYTQLELKKRTVQLTKENISELVPQGISGFYKKQFKHLENQLIDFGSSEVKLKRFLEILVAARGPLPLNLLPECLGLPYIEYEVCETIIGIVSSILPVYDNCFTIYHKSLRDWLMSEGYKKHAFTVDSLPGQKYLWEVCKKEFDKSIPFSNPSPVTKYALDHGISHMIKSTCETSYHLSVHVKIVHARIRNGIENYQMERECKKIVKNLPSSLSSELLHELNWHMQHFTHVLPHSSYQESAKFYLQSVANRIDCSTETRLLARSLLKQGHHFWFEDLNATNLTNNFYKSVFLRARVTCMSVSPNEQLLATGCEDGWISIFRVPNFQELHTLNTMPEYIACRPDLNSPSVAPLRSCSFSLSSVRLVTCDGSEKVKLWDVNSGNLLAQLQAGGSVDCCSFSESGLFIVADKEREADEWGFQRDQCSDVFTVWNALTLQRVDRRIIHQGKVDPARSDASFWSWFPPDRNNNREFLLSFDDYCLNVFQSPNALLAARSCRPDLHNLPRRNQTRYHWRSCVLHHINVLIKLTASEEDERVYCGKCPCNFNRPAPVKVKKLYVVPFVNKLVIFSVADQASMTIQPSFISTSYVISCCCFSPDGSFLATCANDRSHSVLIWDTKLCTVIQVVEFPLVAARGCWWSDNLLWIYDDGLVKIPISNGRTLDPSGARRLDFKPRELLTFSDVLIFSDQEDSVNVARIKNGELQYVEKLPVSDQILCAAISPCNSIILMVSSELTVHAWKEDQTSQSRHWISSNTGELLNFSHLKFDNMYVTCVQCCITSDSTKGVLLLHFQSTIDRSYLILVDLSSLTSKITKMMAPKWPFNLKRIYAGNSYCVVLLNCFDGEWLAVGKLATGEYVAQWKPSSDRLYERLFPNQLIVAHSRKDIVAFISQRDGVQFLKVVVPE